MAEGGERLWGRLLFFRINQHKHFENGKFHFFLSLHFQGRVFRDINMPGTSPAERHALYVAMVTTLVQLHTLDWRDLGLEDFGKKEEYAARQVCVCVCVCVC